MSPVPANPVVLFDLDDTLMAHREAVATGIARHMRARAYRGDEQAAAQRWHRLEEQHYTSYLEGSLTYEGQRRARAAAFAEAFGEDLDEAAATAWFGEYIRHYRDAWTLHDDALPALDAITAALPAVRFGIITNGELAFQTSKVERLALQARMEHVVASGDVGVAKPDARIFLEALRRFDGTAPVSAAAYVGDRLRTDAIGAARAGLLGVWLDRRGVEPAAADAAEADAVGVVRIRGLDELPALLTKRLGRPSPERP
ncbi:HAD family hydrolase [Agromyces humi]|uniref:HAD family hydrolase n=1 Tax=Agromyces humi TaxID=1766800 RepID=UPI001358F407|nr:HAD family hydrolase [Agromyces humi]